MGAAQSTMSMSLRRVRGKMESLRSSRVGRIAAAEDESSPPFADSRGLFADRRVDEDVRAQRCADHTCPRPRRRLSH